MIVSDATISRTQRHELLGPYSQTFIFFILTNVPIEARVLHYTKVERLARDIHSIELIGLIRKLQEKLAVAEGHAQEERT